MSQTSYANKAQEAIAGMIATDRVSRIGSYFNKHSADIPFGILVAQGTDHDRAILPANADAKIIGAVARSQARPFHSLDGINGVDEDGLFNLCESGIVWCRLDYEVEVDRDDAVYVRIESDGTNNTQLGTVSKDDADTERKVRVPNARFAGAHVKDPSGAHIAPVELRGFSDAKSDPFSTLIEHPEAGADMTIYSFTVPAGRWAILEDAKLHNLTGLVGDGSNFFNVKLQTDAGVVLANWSTDTGEEGSIGAGTVHQMVLADVATRRLPPGTVVELFLDEDGSAALPAGRVIPTWRLV